MAIQQINKTQQKSPEAWNTPTFQNSWVNLGGSWGAAAYMKDNQGFVWIRGLVQSGTAGTAIFTLPVGYRPIADCYFGTASNAAFAAVKVTAAGAVMHDTGSTAALSLDTIRFRGEQ